VKLSNEMLINAPAEQAWALLTDMERIASIVPGAALERADGDEFVCTMPVKVGPIKVKYQGTARIQEMDASGYRAVISARGADASGQGQVQAVITARLTSEGEQTRVLVDSGINISGRLAQFGRGALADLSARLLAEFARNLNAMLAEAPSVPGAAVAAMAAPAMADLASAANQQPAASVDLGHILGPVLARRALPVLAGAVLGALVMRWFTRHS